VNGDASFWQRWFGWPHNEAAGGVLDTSVGIDGQDLSQGLPEFLLEVLRIPVFLPELVAQIAPAQLDPFRLLDPA
jgi:hypothetical protein